MPHNHHLHQFLTFLKHERGFADATIVNRKRSLKPFLALGSRTRRTTVTGDDHQILHQHCCRQVEAN
jgi:site-specific recombinase XerC